jgi:hypothetical protein
MGTGAGQGAAAKQELSLLATPVSGNTSDYVLLVSGVFRFNRAGTVQLQANELKGGV